VCVCVCVCVRVCVRVCVSVSVCVCVMSDVHLKLLVLLSCVCWGGGRDVSVSV
jgi:hypothetical protein